MGREGLASSGAGFKVQDFIQDFFLGVGNVDACNGHMHVSIHPIGFSRNSGQI